MNLGKLKPVYAHDGPFISVHLDVSRDTEDAAHQIETRWAKMRAELSTAGAADTVLDRVGELVTQPTHVPGEARRTVVMSDDEVLLDDVRSGHGAADETAEYGPLPELTAWLEQLDGELPFVLAVTDREGAEVEMYRAVSRPPAEHEEVEGNTLHINKVQAGHEAHKQFQRHTEEQWRHNAEEVAEVIRRLWAEHGPRVVIVAGEVRARAEVRSVLEDGGDLLVEEVEGGGRAAGSSQDALWSDVTAVLGRLIHAEREDLIEALGAGTVPGQSVARGLRNVLETLVQGQVGRLVLDLDSARTQTVHPEDYPGLPLPRSAGEAGRLRADQALLAAAAATDADLSLLPEQAVGSQGVAAFLRWEA